MLLAIYTFKKLLKLVSDKVCFLVLYCLLLYNQNLHFIAFGLCCYLYHRAFLVFTVVLHREEGGWGRNYFVCITVYIPICFLLWFVLHKLLLCWYCNCYVNYIASWCVLTCIVLHFFFFLFCRMYHTTSLLFCFTIFIALHCCSEGNRMLCF